MTADRQATVKLSMTQTVNIPNINVRHQKLGGGAEPVRNLGAVVVSEGVRGC